MGKPSIFSRDYQKKMKRRKIAIVISIILIIAIFLCAWFIRKGKGLISNKKNTSINNEKVDSNNKADKDSSANKNANVSNEKQKVSKEDNKTEGYEVKLSSGEKVKIIYEQENNDKKFKYIYPVDSKVKYDISPSGKKAVVYDDKAQRIIYVDIDGKVSDITNNSYTSTSGSVTVNHDQFINTKPDYVWCNMPKFIDENNIAYISQLPWLNKTSKYIWILNIPNNSHINTQSVYGEEITIDKISDKGLKIVVDGKTLFLNANGGVTE